MSLTGTRSHPRILVTMTVLFGWALFGWTCSSLLAAEVDPAADSPTTEQPADDAAEKPAEPGATAPDTEASPAADPPPAEPPAESPPAEGGTDTAPAPPAETPPAPDFTRLIQPAVTDLLKLTGEQRATITELMNQRDEALSGAEAAEKTTVIEESDKKLADVLTEGQLAELAKLKPEPKLRLNFRYAIWTDVLQWVAEQADLSLVMDAPPPATFNYTDAQEFTPTQVIDLLNSVLLTKDFTLIRRGRMLLVVDLVDGVPEGVVPRVTLGELARPGIRGQFELVEVVFPLGRRPAETVHDEIKLLLGPHGKVVPLPATSQLKVIDTARNMRAIHTVIQSITEPPEVPTDPLPPELKKYEISPVERKLVEQTVAEFAPSAKIVPNENPDELIVHAVPSEHAMIESVLEQMKTGATTDNKARLETYPLADTVAEEIVSTLSKMVPAAELSLNATTGKLVAWATPDDQAKIKETIEQLDGQGTPATTRQLEIYSLTKVDPDQALSLLQTILPDARLAVDKQTRSLISVAVPGDQEVVRKTLARLQPEKPTPDIIPELRYYPLPMPVPETVVTVLKRKVPGATIVLDPSGEQLMVVATTAEHETISATVGQIVQATFAKLKNTLKIHPVTLAQRKRFETILTTLRSQLPGVRVITDAEPGELAVWAKEQQHEVVEKILDELKRDVPNEEKYQLMGYSITAPDRSGVLTVLQEMFPDTRLVLDEQTGRLLVWTRPAEHETIQAAIEQLQPQQPGPDTPVLGVYPYPHAAGQAVTASVKAALRERLAAAGESDSLVAALQQLVPKAKITLDAQNLRIVAVATAADHEGIEQNLKQVAADLPPIEEPQLEIYRLRGPITTALVETLQSLVPEAQVTPDEEDGKLIVQATPAEHERLMAGLAKLKQGGTLGGQRQVQVYRLTKADPAAAMKLLQELLPDAQLSVDETTGSLIALATPADQQVIDETLKGLEPEGPDPNAPELQFYTLTKTPPESLLGVLKNVAPKAEITLGADKKHLTVLATSADQAAIKAIVEKVDEAAPQTEKRQLEVYRLTKADPASTLKLLGELLPDAQLTLDPTSNSLIAVAVPADQQAIKALLAQLQPEGLDPEGPQLRFYPLAQKPPSNLVTVLTELVPKAQISLAEDGRRLTVVATPADHQVIATTIQQIESVGPGELELRFYPLVDTPPPSVLTALGDLVPGAKITLEAENKRLMVVAAAADHDRLKTTLEKILATLPPEEKHQLIVYPVTTAQRKRFEAILATITADLPGVKVISDGRPGELAIWAKPTQHVTIAGMIEKLKSDVDAGQKQQFVAYQLESADPQSVMNVMTTLFPDVKTVMDEKAARLSVWATVEEQDMIRQAIEQMDTGTPIDRQEKIMVYPLPGADLSVAIGVLESLVPDATYQSDATAETIIVRAIPSDHDKIKQLVEQLQGENAPEKRPRIEVYPLSATGWGGPSGLDPEKGEKIVETLQPMVPEAQLRVDPTGTKLVAFAKPEQHETIKTTLEKLGHGGTASLAAGGTVIGTRRVEVYPLTRVDPQATLALLQTLVPGARLSVDEQARRLVAMASVLEHQVIQETLDRLQPKQTGPDAPVLQIYPFPYSKGQGLSPEVRYRIRRAWLSRYSSEPPQFTVPSGAGSSTLLTALQQLVPNSQFTLDESSKRLMAFASPKDHEVIKTALEQIKESGPSEPEVRFHPLSQKPPESLIGALQMLAPEAQITLEADEQRLMVVATAADHDLIKSTIERVEKTLPPEEKNQLVTYAVTPAQQKRFEALVEELTDDLPGIKLIADAEPGELSLWAKPTQHVLLAEMIEQLKGDVPPEQQYKLIAYPVDSADPQSVLTVLQSLFPNTQIVLDATARRLAVWTRPEEHAAVKAAIEELDGGKEGDSGRQVQVYPLTKADPSTTLALLQTLVPFAQLSADPQTGSIVALARPSEHKTIQDTLSQLQPQQAGPNDPVLKFYTLKEAAPANLVEGLVQLVPEAQVTMDAAGKRLMVVARPSDHAKIATNVKEIEAAAAKQEKSELTVYPVTQAQRKRFEAVLETVSDELPGIKVITDAQPGELSIWATPSQHAVIQGLIDQLKLDTPPEQQFQLVAYEIKTADPQSVLTVMTTLFPGTQISLDQKTRRLLVWTRPQDHAAIKAALQQMDSETTGDTQEKFMVYPILKADPDVAIEMLQELLPDVKFGSDITAGTIVAWARQRDHEIIAKTIETMQAGPDEAHRPTIAVYPCGEGDPTNMQTMLTALVPEATITVDAENRSLVALAMPEDHKTLAAAVAKMTAEGAAEGKRTVEVYNLESIPAAGAVLALSVVVPEAQCSVGADPQQLVAWARAADHQRIQDVIDKMQDEGPPEKRPSLVVYSLKASTADDAMPVLATAVPGAQLNAGTLPNQILAWAKPEEHKKIEETITKLDQEEPAETAPRAMVYSLEETSSTRAYYKLRLIREAVPTADFTLGADPNNLIAWARPADHEKIKQIVEELTSKGPPEKRPTLVIYTLNSTTAAAAESVLSLMVPQADLTVGEDPSQLIAWARPTDHEEIKAALAQIDVEEPPETATRLVIYTLQSTTADDALPVLSTAAPNAQINEGTLPSQLFVWARPEDHKKIEETIAKLDAQEPEATAPRAMVYSLETTSSSSAYYQLRLLREAVPTADFTLGADPSNLIAWARPAEHEKIKEIVEQLASKGPSEKRPTMVVYTLESISASTAIRVLSAAVPAAELDEGDDPSQMIAWARPADHEEIKTALEKIDIQEPPETAATLVVYMLQTVTAEDALPVLSTSTPNAKINAGTAPNQLFAWARPEDHKKIEATIAKLDAQEPEATAPRAVVYALEGMRSRMGAIYRVQMLQEAVPQASFTLGSDLSQLIAWARPAEHKKIKEIVEQLASKGPPEKRPTMVVYTLKSRTATAAIGVLSAIVPEAELSEGDDASQLVAWARPTDHEEIKTVLEKLDVIEPPETAVKMEIYTLQSMTATEAIPLLTTAVPQAKVNTGAQPNQLIVWARPAEHLKIKDALQTLDPEEKAATLVVYTLESVAVETAITALSSIAPGASCTPGAEPSQLIAFARPKEHEKIQQAIDKMDQVGPAETAGKVVVYTLDSATAAGAMTFLVSTFPQAKFTTGLDPRRVIAWARPADHVKIQAAIDEMSKKESEATARTVKTYPVEVNGAAKVILLLSTTFPDAQLSVGADPSQLIAYAGPADHELIEKAIEQIEAGGLRDTDRQLATYQIRSEDVTSLIDVLDPVLTQNARFVTDPNRDSLIVWATPKYQEAIKNAVEEFRAKMPEPVEPTSKVYRLREADPEAALTVLTALVPAAEIALDTSTGNLVVSALPDDHEKIQETVDEMDREDAAGQAASLQIYPLESVDPASVLPALSSLFAMNPRVQLSLDSRNDALIAVAPPKDHERIRELLDKVEQGALTDTKATLQLYSLKDVDSYSAIEILETVLQKQGVKADLSVDSGTNQLVAIARAAQHDTIQETLEKLRQEERTMEILQLDFIEPYTAETAIRRLFSDEGFSSQPMVDSDVDTGQLFIRATEEQHKKIRQLLIKLGETELTSLSTGSDSRLRVIPFAGDAKAAVTEIQRVWPQLRDNPIRVVTPSAIAPQPPKDDEPTNGPPQPQPKTNGESTEDVGDDDTIRGADGDDRIPAEKANEDTANQPEDAPADPQQPSEPPAPVLVVVGDGSITIASEDPEALDQFESLLRTMSQRTGYAGRDFSIYAVRNTSAVGIASTLTQLFASKIRTSNGTRSTFRRTSRLVIVPDERLNTILVQGSRTDRSKIENLLKVLDTAEVPETLAANKPKLIPIKNTEAERIEQVIRDIFKTQLSSRSGSAALPSWLSTQLSVDDMTNSLVVMAPSPLVDEIIELAERLDRAAGEDPARGLKIIALKKINAERAVEALERIRGGGSVRPRRRSASP